MPNRIVNTPRSLSPSRGDSASAASFVQYLGRFWTQFEAWLSMRTCSKDGLLSDSDEKDYRFEIRCLYTAGRTGTGEQVKRLWLSGESGKGVSAEEAHRILDGKDIEVTNKSDKANQLPKIMKLDEKVKEYYKSATVDASA